MVASDILNSTLLVGCATLLKTDFPVLKFLLDRESCGSVSIYMGTIWSWALMKIIRCRLIQPRELNFPIIFTDKEFHIGTIAASIQLISRVFAHCLQSDSLVISPEIFQLVTR